MKIRAVIRCQPCVKKKQREHANRDGAADKFGFGRSASADITRPTPRAPPVASSTPGVDAALVKTFRQATEKLADPADQRAPAIPEIAIHEIGEPRRESGEGDEGVCVEFIEPHLVFEEAEQRGLRLRERIDSAALR